MIVTVGSWLLLLLYGFHSNCVVYVVGLNNRNLVAVVIVVPILSVQSMYVGRGGG